MTLDKYRYTSKMLEQQLLSNQKIINCLNTEYGIEVVTLKSLLLGADQNALIYKAQTYNRLSYFVKLKQDHHPTISVAIINFLQEVGIHSVIPPIKTIFGASIQYIENCTLVVYPFIEGQNGFSRNLTGDQWIKLGETLRQIHAVDLPLSIQNKIRQETYSSKWRNLVRSLYDHIETKPIQDEIALDLWKFIKENRVTIHRLVDRAEELSQQLQNQVSKFVLCHSDIHAGNVLIDRKGNIYIVDWDESILAPKERDLMFIGAGIANIWNKAHEEKLFYQGYGKTKINMTLLAYYRYERIVEDIALFGEALFLTATEDKKKHVMYKQFIDMFAPQGVVEIALKTGKNI